MRIVYFYLLGLGSYQGWNVILANMDYFMEYVILFKNIAKGILPKFLFHKYKFFY